LKWCLVYPPFEDKRDRSAYYVAPPLGLLSIAAYLESDGHEVTVHDFVLQLKDGRLRPGHDVYDRCAEVVLASAPDVVGFGTQCSTGPSSINIARRIKQRKPDVAIVLGGHDVTFISERYLKAFPFIDAVLGGEAELTLPKLAGALAGSRSWGGIAGLAWRRSGEIAVQGGEERIHDLDRLLAPSYHLVDDLEIYFANSRKPTILVDSGRGCAFACEFCQTTLLSGRKVRYRSVESLISELQGYRSRYSDFEAYFVHDLFTARRQFVLDLCDALMAADLNLSWQCRCRIDEVDRPLLRKMSDAGCRMLLYGVESGSENTLEHMNKRLRRGVRSEVTDRVRWTVEHNIFPSLSMVVGIPEETFEDLEATLRLAAEFIQIGRVNAFIQLMSPLPGTALAQRVAHRLEYRGEHAPTAFSQGIEFSDGRRLREDEDLIASMPDIFQSFHVVTPDHTDLDLCVDISLGYCKLLEVYGWTYKALAEHLGTGYVELFRRFRRHFEREHPGRRGLVGARDHELWDSFIAFVDESLSSGHMPEHLRETIEFERIVNDLSVVRPVPEAEVIPPGPFRLHSAARLFRTRSGLPWQNESQAAGAYLVMMGADRLKVVQLDTRLANGIDILNDATEAGLRDPIFFRRLSEALKPLHRFGVLEPIEQPVEAAV
jgi:radical SAM superfamily enzyme YgiQ (UPF0313 family)